MQRVKQDRAQIALDRAVEVILLGLCLAASIYGLVQISPASNLV